MAQVLSPLKKSQRKLFLYKLFQQPFGSWDVRAEYRGHSHQKKVRFPAAPVVWRNFLTPGHPGVRVRNVRGKSGPKSLCLCCFFFSPELIGSANTWCIVFYLVLKPLTCGRQSWCLGWTYKLPGGQKFSIKLPPLSVGFPQRRPSNLIKRPRFINSPGVRFLL